ncbi:hypothetical protein Pcinc_019408 [Petrolisthes cinctipes]|uniref:Uncharacterized protein n=1 Tax=Petrolisthes cinctipes TaxID=88211 RepID=A0AAE1KKH3_PETCI|nr:hypothetical protein Pcinc_019408 [Petrolisthes cinctipes]
MKTLECLSVSKNLKWGEKLPEERMTCPSLPPSLTQHGIGAAPLPSCRPAVASPVMSSSGELEGALARPTRFDYKVGKWWIAGHEGCWSSVGLLRPPRDTRRILIDSTTPT